MIRINLLPYRAKLRQRQILFHIAWFLAVVATVVVLCISVNIVQNVRLASRIEKQKELGAKIKKLNRILKEIDGLREKREEVQGKLRIVDELQVGRFRSLNMLYEISRIIPKNVWIDSLGDGRTEITIKGGAGTSEGISEFMRALDESPYFQKDSIRLGSVKEAKEKGTPIRVFDIRASFAKLDDGKDGKKGKVVNKARKGRRR